MADSKVARKPSHVSENTLYVLLVYGYNISGALIGCFLIRTSHY